MDVSRRILLSGGALAGAAAVVTRGGTAADASTPTRAGHGDAPAEHPDAFLQVPPGELPQETSTFFSTVFVEHAGTYAAPGSDGGWFSGFDGGLRVQVRR